MKAYETRDKVDAGDLVYGEVHVRRDASVRVVVESQLPQVVLTARVHLFWNWSKQRPSQRAFQDIFSRERKRVVAQGPPVAQKGVFGKGHTCESGSIIVKRILSVSPKNARRRRALPSAHKSTEKRRPAATYRARFFEKLSLRANNNTKASRGF